MSNVKSTLAPCLLLILLSASNSWGAPLIHPPLNVAVLVGQTAVLECRAAEPPPYSRVMWGEWVTGQGSIISDNDVILDHPNKDRYRIIHVSPIQFDLEIRDVRLEDGGRYVCQEMLSGPPNVFRGEAELIVLDGTPNCTTTAPFDGNVIEGQNYTAECIIHYQGGISPSMHWSGPPPFIVGNNPPNPTTVWSGVAYTVDRTMDTRAFECLTNFTTIPPNLPEDAATNLPTWSHLFRANQIFVFWGPKDLYASPIKQEYAVGDTITCYADAKPEASFQWQNMLTLNLTQGEVFTVTADMVGLTTPLRCNAQNNINGFVYTQNLFIEAYVPAPTSPTTTASTLPTTTLPAFGHCHDLSGHWVSLNPYAEIYLTVDHSSQLGELYGIMKNQSDTIWVEVVGTVRRSDYVYIGLTAIWPFNDGITGMAGECHSCRGQEVMLIESLWRAQADSVGCGIGSVAAPDAAYNFARLSTRFNLNEREFDVFRPTKEVSGRMGIKLKKR